MNSKKLILKLAVLALGLATHPRGGCSGKSHFRLAGLTFAAPEAVVIAVMLPEKSVASAMGMTDPRYPIPTNVVAYK